MGSVRQTVDPAAVAVLGGIVLFVLASQLFLAEPVLRYAAALLGFSLWMAWFVLAAVRWLTIGP